MDFIFEYWLQILFGLLISYLGYVRKKVNGFIDSVKQNEISIKELLRSVIIFNYNEHINKKYITLTEKEVLNNLYLRFKKIGDDSLIEELIKEVNLIPIKKDGD
jgi:hypothetical protein